MRAVLRVARRYAAAEPGALPVLVGDLSRPRGGDFGQRYGIIGHSSHQNGLDVAQTVLVGPNLSLQGPAGVVRPYPGHDNHLHVRIPNPA